jgi:uncharacterized membrane protein YhaH (DUF805 family)
VVEWFGYGFGFVAVTLFMMQQLATGKYKMSHYAIATSAMQLGLILPGVWSGWLSDHIGYRNFFTWVMASTVFSFVVAWLVPFKTDEDIASEGQAAVPSAEWLFLTLAGRMGRAPYWFGQVILIFLVVLAMSIDLAIHSDGGMWTLSLGAFLLTTLPIAALDAKRWHDRNYSGSWAILRPVAILALIGSAFLPTEALSPDRLWLARGALALVLAWYFVEIGLRRGTEGANPYGPDPVVSSEAEARAANA